MKKKTIRRYGDHWERSKMFEVTKGKVQWTDKDGRKSILHWRMQEGYTFSIRMINQFMLVLLSMGKTLLPRGFTTTLGTGLPHGGTPSVGMILVRIQKWRR